MIHPPHPYNLRPMQVADIPQVMVIESEAFSLPWPARVYHAELTRNTPSYCYVLEMVEGELLGYGCFWLIVDEAHISTLAVAQEWRGRGLGELLLLALIYEAIANSAMLVTLEVRLSNRAAQDLYARYGLQVVGRRKRYYADNQENALVMTAEPLDTAYQARLAQLQAALWVRLSAGRGV